MPSIDRHWKRVRWIGICLIVGVIVVAVVPTAVLMVGTGLALDRALRMADPQDFGIFVMPLVFALSALSMLRGARARERIRADVRSGRGDVMLPADMTPNPENAPDVSREPLRLLWHPDASDRTRTRTITVASITGIALIWLIGVGVAIAIITPDAFWPVEGVALLIALLDSVLYLQWRARQPVPIRGVIAGDAGLHWVRPRKSEVAIPWNDARLLEVWQFGSGTNVSAGYAVFSEHALIEWLEYPPDRAPASADGASPAEMVRRQRALLDLIAARTGLSPRTFALELAAVPQAEQITVPLTPRRRVSAIGVAILLALAAAPATIAIGALLLPFTSIPLLNLYVAATTGLLALFILAMDVWVIIAKPRRAPRASPRVTLPPVHFVPGETVTLRSPRRLRERNLALVAGLVYAGNMYPLIISIGDVPAGAPLPFGIANLHRAEQTGLGVLVFIVLAIAWITAVDQRWQITADAEGIRWRSGSQRLTLPWDAITRLNATADGTKVLSYSVVAGDAHKTEIGWSPDARRGPSFPPMTLDDPASVLAAFVAQHTSLPLAVVPAHEE